VRAGACTEQSVLWRGTGNRPPMAAASIVAAFAVAHGIDEAVIAFAAGAVEDRTDADVDAAVDLLAAACDAGAADVEALHAALTDACVVVEKSPPRAPRAAAHASPSALLKCLDLEGRRRQRDLEVEEPTTASAPEPERAAPAASVDALACLFPAASRSFLAHALLATSDAGDDAAAAAAWMTEGDAGDAEAAWRAARAAAAAAASAAAAADDAAKVRTLDRFSHAPETSGAAPARAWGGADAPAHKKKNQPTTRFLDGAPITTRDKYVVVADKPEWDGGSRGKVKTKGKRGTGVAG